MTVTNKQSMAVYDAVNNAIRAMEKQKDAGHMADAEFQSAKLILCRLRDIGLYGRHGGSLRSYFKDIGAKGGSAAAKNLTQQEREDRARNASKARWGVVKGGRK